MKIALDVDGVLADVIVSWLNYSNSIRPSISKNQITDLEFWKKLKLIHLIFIQYQVSVGKIGNRFRN